MSDITATTTNDEIYQMVIDYVATPKCSGEEGDGYMQSLFDARKAIRRWWAEEEEMMWRETIIHAGGRFIGASLIPAEVSA